MTGIKITDKKPRYIRMDESTIKLYIGQEIDNLIEERGLNNKKDFDELYFRIFERLDQYFIEYK